MFPITDTGANYITFISYRYVDVGNLYSYSSHPIAIILWRKFNMKFIKMRIINGF